MGDLADARRRAATRAFVRYFLLFFVVVGLLGAFSVYAVLDAKRQTASQRALRVEYCTELEKLKTQNREDVANDKKNFARNLRLLGLKDSPELRQAAQEDWARKLRRNAPKPCPYTGH